MIKCLNRAYLINAPKSLTLTWTRSHKEIVVISYIALKPECNCKYSVSGAFHIAASTSKDLIMFRKNQHEATRYNPLACIISLCCWESLTGVGFTCQRSWTGPLLSFLGAEAPCHYIYRFSLWWDNLVFISLTNEVILSAPRAARCAGPIFKCG